MFFLSCAAIAVTALTLQHRHAKVFEDATRPSLKELEARLDAQSRALDLELAALLGEHRRGRFPAEIRVTRELEIRFQKLEEEMGDGET